MSELEHKAKKINYQVDDIKCHCEILDTTKGKSFYILFNLWVNSGDEDFDIAINRLERKVKHNYLNLVKETFSDYNPTRGICIVDWPSDSSLNRLKNKNVYVGVELTIFFDNMIAFDKVNVKGINELVFTYSQNVFNVIKEVDGLVISSKKK